MFQEQAANFREAVYLLFGYRVDMAAEAASAHSTKPQSTSFVLRPQHADSPRMQLLFQLRRGRMELVPTEYSTRRLQREVETFIERCASNSAAGFDSFWPESQNATELVWRWRDPTLCLWFREFRCAGFTPSQRSRRTGPWSCFRSRRSTEEEG